MVDLVTHCFVQNHQTKGKRDRTCCKTVYIPTFSSTVAACITFQTYSRKCKRFWLKAFPQLFAGQSLLLEVIGVFWTSMIKFWVVTGTNLFLIDTQQKKKTPSDFIQWSNSFIKFASVCLFLLCSKSCQFVQIFLFLLLSDCPESAVPVNILRMLWMVCSVERNAATWIVLCSCTRSS